MSLLVSGIRLPLDAAAEEAVEQAARQLGLSQADVERGAVSKTSVDARRRPVRLVHTVELTLHSAEKEERTAARCPGARLRRPQALALPVGEQPLPYRPVVVGFGPAGMFAALLLAQRGFCPLVLERGAPVEQRVEAVERFWQTGRLSPETNVQFGEGGAGTFSDGKLVTRINDPRCEWILRTLVRFGAPEEIMTQAKPHIGTDRLCAVVRRLRTEIVRLGGEVRFSSAMTGLALRNGRVAGVETADAVIPAQAVVLAIGHSARDTFAVLRGCGLPMEAKPFSVGVRIEHLQSEIDRGLYGAYAGHPLLPPGEYQLSHRTDAGAVYTFCMCPGGTVVAAASEDGGVVTNGMSRFARDGRNANAALVVSVEPKDLDGGDAFAGMRFQRALEQAAFAMAGGDYAAPAQTAGRFLAGKAGLTLGRVAPTYARGIAAGNFAALFPARVTRLLRLGLTQFDRRLPGFAADDALLTGVETRTSSPLRILRAEQTLTAWDGLYPCGEGAGYAGGIMSAAADGLRVAQAILSRYRPA